MCAGGTLSKGALCKQIVWRGSGRANAVTELGHDAAGRLTYTVDPDGLRTDYAYHGSLPASPYPLLKLQTNTFGHSVYYSNYHGLSGQAGKVCGPEHLGAPATDKCDELVFDKYGRTTAEKRAFLDGNGLFQTHPVRTLIYNDGTLPPGVIDTREQENPVSHVSPQLPAVQARSYFNRWGQVVLAQTTFPSVQGCSGQHFTYDGLGRLTRARVPTLQTCGFSSAPGGDSYQYRHDPLDRLTRVTDPYTQLKRATYHGRTVEVVDEEGNPSTLSFDGFGQTARVSRPVGADLVLTMYDHDALGRVTRITGAENEVYEYTYHMDGALRSARLPDLQEQIFDYTPGGRIHSVTRPNSDTVLYEYDHGRLALRLVTAAGACAATEPVQRQRFYYDEQTFNLGQLTRVVEDNRYSKTLDYDGRGNLAGQWMVDQATRDEIGLEAIYTATGSRLKTYFPSGRTLDSRYDPAGRLSQVFDNSAVDVALTYAAHGKPARVNGWIQGLNRLDFDRTYDYDSKQRLESLDTSYRSLQTQTQWKIDHEYYENNWLRSTRDDQRGLDHSYTYDAAGRLKTASGYLGGTLTYGYHINGAPSSVSGPKVAESYAYLTASRQTLKSLQGSGFTIDVSHDGAGQQCTATRVGPGSYQRTYEWYGDGNLARVAQGSKWSRFSYDETGTRWKTEDAQGHALHAGDEIEKRKTDYTDHVGLPGTRIALSSPGNHRVYFSDASSTALVVEEDGSVAHSTSYLPYGGKLPIVQGSGSVFDFNDKRRDPTGVLHYGARSYEPSLRLFLSPDPLLLSGPGDPSRSGGLHPYVYAGGNPTTLEDLLGLDPVANYFIAADTGLRYDVFRTSNIGGEWPWYARWAPWFVNTPANVVGFLSNLGNNAYESGVDALANAEGVPRECWKGPLESFPALAYSSGPARLSALGSRATALVARLTTRGVPALRQQYVSAVTGLAEKVPGMRQAGMSSEQIARALHAARRSLGVQFKDLTPTEKLVEIHARNLKMYGDKLGPSIDWLRAHGKSWDDIINSATRAGGKDLGF